MCVVIYGTYYLSNAYKSLNLSMEKNCLHFSSVVFVNTYCAHLSHMVPYLFRAHTMTAKFICVELCVKSNVYGHPNLTLVVTHIIF